MTAPRLITFTSDLGSAYAAQVKAVLYRSMPAERVVELTHDLPAHQIPEGAFLLRAMAAAFPRGTVHLAVVDPGVGGRRHAAVIECADGSRLVGPDNGLLWPLAERLGVRAAYRIDPDRLGLSPPLSPTFAGRDLFAPVAALLARGRAPRTIGSPIAPTELDLPVPARRDHGAEGRVVHIDRFGNAVTNVPTGWAPATAKVLSVSFGRSPKRRLSRVAVYEDLRPAAPGVLGSSFGLLEIALREGRASDRLRLKAGGVVRFEWLPARPTRRK